MPSRFSHRLLAAALLLATGAARARHPAITLNLNEVDLGTFIQTVSEVTGKNFVVAPNVRGKVSVISSSPMDADAVYATFLSVLQTQGFAAVPDGAIIKIVPEANVRELDTSSSGDENVPRDAVVTEALTIHHASATQLVPVLRPLVPQWGHLAAYAPANMLIVSDRAANVRRLASIVHQIDEAGDQGVEIATLTNATADEAAKVLAALIQQDKQVDPTAHPVVALPDERTNSIIVAGDKPDRQHYLQVIKQLDSPDTNSGSTQVVYLHYADAESIAPILQGYAQQVKQVQQKQSSSTSTFGGSSFGSNNSTPTAPSPPPQQTFSQNGGGANGQGSSNSDLKVLSDRDTNSLVITAPPKIMQQIKKVIAQLDIRRAQVMVEGIVAEVSAQKQSQLGLDFAIFNPSAIAGAGLFNTNTVNTIGSLSGSSSSLTGVTTTTSSLAGSSLSGISPLASVALGLLGQGATIAGGAITNGGKSGTSFGFILNALASDSDTNILSAPSLVTLDNEEAKISVGQSVPELTGSYSNSGVSSASGVVNPFQTIEDKDVGLSLGITPTINDGNTIRLKITLENSSISSGTAGSSDLITNKRTLSDTVTVENGQILVLGGLVDNEIDATRSGIPFLSDIPVIGALFGSKGATRTKRNLMVFIHPVVLRNSSDADYYTRLKYEQERNAEIDALRAAPPAVGGDPPVIYRWDEYLRTHDRPSLLHAPAPGSTAPGARAPAAAATAVAPAATGQLPVTPGITPIPARTDSIPVVPGAGGDVMPDYTPPKGHRKPSTTPLPEPVPALSVPIPTSALPVPGDARVAQR